MIKKLPWLPGLLVGLLTYCLYLPSAAAVIQLSPDATEFADVARRFSGGEGYVLGIKAYHLGDTDVIHDGLIHRPPLYPLIVAGLLRLDLGWSSAQIVNVLFAAMSAALVCSIGSVLFGRTVGFASGVLAASNPIAFEQQVPILSDALATVLTLLAVRLLMWAVARSAVAPAVLAGVVFGMGYLARPPVMAVWLALLLLLALMSVRRRMWHVTVGLAFGAGILCGPITVYSVLTLGRLSYSGKGYLYGVVSDADVMENGFAALPLSPVAFILASPSTVLGAILRVLTLYAHALFLEREWLAPLCVGWPLVILNVIRRKYDLAAWIALVAAGANFLFYGLTWSSWQDRFMLLSLFLLLPFGVDGLYRALCLVFGGRRVQQAAGRAGGQLANVALGLVVLCIAILWSQRFIDQYQGRFRYGERPAGTRVTHGVRWTGPPRWVNDGSFDETVTWIERRTDVTDVLAHGQPWPYTFFTARPSVLLPYRLTDADLRRFLIEYRVAYVLHDSRDPQRREYREQLQALSSSGVQSTRVESLIVYDTRPLWQASVSR